MLKTHVAGPQALKQLLGLTLACIQPHIPKNSGHFLKRDGNFCCFSPPTAEPHFCPMLFPRAYLVCCFMKQVVIDARRRLATLAIIRPQLGG